MIDGCFGGCCYYVGRVWFDRGGVRERPEAVVHFGVGCCCVDHGLFVLVLEVGKVRDLV